jgi:carboxymethylenebutenolidase
MCSQRAKDNLGTMFESLMGFLPIAQDAKAFGEKLEKAGCTYEILTYSGQGHAFMNQSPEAVERKKAMGLPEHDQKTVDLAWSRTFAWFDKYVKA